MSGKLQFVEVSQCALLKPTTKPAPRALGAAGAAQHLGALLHSLGRASGIAFSVELDNIDGCLSPEAEIHLYPVVQE